MGDHTTGVDDHPLLPHPLAKEGYSPTELRAMKKNEKESVRRRRYEKRMGKRRGVKGGGGVGWVEGGGLAKFESGRYLGEPENPLADADEDGKELSDDLDEDLGENMGASEPEEPIPDNSQIMVQKARDGGYLIGKRGSAGVRRTVGDFLYVHARLREVYRGLFIPALPALALSGRITHGYAHEERVLRGLQGFIEAILKHPRLSQGGLVQAFVSGDGWEDERQKGLTTKDDVGLFGWLGFVGWKTLRGFNESVGTWLDERQEEVAKDQKMEDRQGALTQYVEGLSKSLERLRKGLGVMEEGRELMEKKMEEVGTLVDEFRGLEKEGGYEASAVLEAFSRACALHATDGPQASRVGESRKTTEQFRQTIATLEKRASVARAVLKTRGEEKAWYEYAVKDYMTKRDQLDKRGGPNGGAARLREAVTDAAAEVARKRDAYAIIARDVDSEMQKYREEVHQGLEEGLVNVSKDMVNWHKQMTLAWRAVETASQARGQSPGRCR